MSRNNYSRGYRCSDCGVRITNHSTKCCSCNTRGVGANYRGLPGKRRKYQEILAELATQPPPQIASVNVPARDKAGRLIKDEYRLRLCCECCGGKRSDKSRKFCGPCYARGEKPNFNEPATRMMLSPWQTLPDGTRMRTVTGV
jgi:hypothetical protein